MADGWTAMDIAKAALHLLGGGGWALVAAICLTIVVARQGWPWKRKQGK